MPDVTVAIVNYNSKNYLRGCLQSLYQNNGRLSFETYVLDNASGDNVDELKSSFPQVNFIQNQINLGYARANNIVLKKARSRYLLLLNPDVVLPEKTLPALVQFLKGHPQAAMVGPKLIKENGRIDLACCRSFPTPASGLFKLTGLSHLFPRKRLLAQYNLTFQNHKEKTEVDSVCGACMLIRKDVLGDIGLFDENFFLYGEDLDFAYRAKQKGWKVFYLPQISARHFKRASTSTNKIKALQEFHRAMLIFYCKHYSNKYPCFLKAMVFLGVHLRLSLSVLFLRLKGLFSCRYNSFYHRLYCLLDSLLASVLLILTLPLSLTITILIKLDSPGPVFYVQERLGYKGKPFKMIKFRTMKEDVEKDTGPVFAVYADSRQTKIGSLLRRWGLDELPQLINIIKGQMNFVGPRPERPFFVAKFKKELPDYIKRLEIKCGVTGWAQVNNLRGNNLIKERLGFDLDYLRRWSVLFDLKILLLSFFALCKPNFIHGKH